MKSVLAILSALWVVAAFLLFDSGGAAWFALVLVTMLDVWAIVRVPSGKGHKVIVLLLVLVNLLAGAIVFFMLVGLLTFVSGHTESTSYNRRLPPNFFKRQQLASPRGIFIRGETSRIEGHEGLVLHFLELRKLPHEVDDPAEKKLLSWCKFLAAESDEEREQLAMTDPNIHDAKEALDRLSADPAAQELARERELAAWNYQRELHLSREEGKAEGLRAAVLHLCHRFAIEVTEKRQSVITEATQAELEKLLDQIADPHRWPDS